MEFLRAKEISPEDDEIPLVVQLQENLKEYLATSTSGSISGSAKTAVESILKDESLLLKYIRLRKGSTLDARKWILRKVRAECDLYPELPLPDRLSESIQEVLSKRIYSVLRNADPDGRLILVFDFGAWDPSVHSQTDMFNTLRYLLKVFVDFTNCHEVGITVIWNGAGASISHMKQITLSTLKRDVDVLHQTHAMPSPRVFYVNAPIFVYPLVKIFRPILPKKFKERLVVSSGLAELHEQIPPAILPKCLGGELPDEEAVSLSFVGLDS